MRVAGSGGGAENECVGGADSTLMIGTADIEAEIAPFSRLTTFRLMAFPWKKSPADTAGSAEGAGGKMSDWNESDCGQQIVNVCESTA